ncbi:hypothetical protein [Ruminococcus sp. AM31-15AC]|uniref:hypothetical protein n=1 Tax=Ruminococcus sp. AM31-15AC TaxID=2293202 RepID=UPI0011C0E678
MCDCQFCTIDCNYDCWVETHCNDCGVCLGDTPTGARSAINAQSAWRTRTAPPAPSATLARMTSCAANAIRVPAAP